MAHVTLAFLLVFFFTILLIDLALTVSFNNTRRAVQLATSHVDEMLDRMEAYNEKTKEGLAMLTESMRLSAEALKSLPNKTSRMEQLIELMKKPFSK